MCVHCLLDLRRSAHGTCTIADLGCGDARLASTLKSQNVLQNLQLKILSYDLHSPSPLVTKADISALPTADGSVDVAIFCLALMGTNSTANIVSPDNCANAACSVSFLI